MEKVVEANIRGKKKWTTDKVKIRMKRTSVETQIRRKLRSKKSLALYRYLQRLEEFKQLPDTWFKKAPVTNTDTSD